ncbi:hypothetical protein ACFQ07_00910 [Actinomadura adrarensis]|uniref:Uncharacterized protein n=1 Tax=Actinomadura adrarensis TaxID=1819600 RepID=A0ABW3CA49_9ACTN
MDIHANSDNQELIRLRADFPGHRIWRSIRYDGRYGDWVATLRDPKAGIDPTVIQGTAKDLRNALYTERAKASKKGLW